jgi:hypothetical protein
VLQGVQTGGETGEGASGESQAPRELKQDGQGSGHAGSDDGNQPHRTAAGDITEGSSRGTRAGGGAGGAGGVKKEELLGNVVLMPLIFWYDSQPAPRAQIP